MGRRSHWSKTQWYPGGDHLLGLWIILLLCGCLGSSNQWEKFCLDKSPPNDLEYTVLSSHVIRNRSSCSDSVAVQTMCINETNFNAINSFQCKILLKFSWTLTRGATRQLEEFQLKVTKNYGEDYNCPVDEQDRKVNGSKNIFDIFFLANYDCCSNVVRPESYTALLSKKHKNKGFCNTIIPLEFNPEPSLESSTSPAMAINDSAGYEPTPSSERLLFSVVQASILIAFIVVVAVVCVVIACVLCRKFRCCRNEIGSMRNYEEGDYTLENPIGNHSHCLMCHVEELSKGITPPECIHDHNNQIIHAKHAMRQLEIIPPSQSDDEMSTNSITFIQPQSSDDEHSEDERFDSGYGAESSCFCDSIQSN